VSMRQEAWRGSMAMELFIGRLSLEVSDEYFEEAKDVIALSRRCVIKHLAHFMFYA
jgi:hypothetical protein